MFGFDIKPYGVERGVFRQINDGFDRMTNNLRRIVYQERPLKKVQLFSIRLLFKNLMNALHSGDALRWRWRVK